MDAVRDKLCQIQFQYAPDDSDAVAVLAARIAARAWEAEGKTISYSELVEGVTFRFHNVRGGVPFQIDTKNWTELDRRIVGDLLGFIARHTYVEAGFFASALVVYAGGDQTPSPSFFKWMKELGVIPDLKEDTILAFWREQLRRAYEAYSSPRAGRLIPEAPSRDPGAALDNELIRAGLLRRIPTPSADDVARAEAWRPVHVTGQPLSKTVIEDRR